MANTDVGIRLTLQGEQQVKASLASVEQGLERMGAGLGKLAHYGTALLLIPQGLNGTVGAAVRAADAVTILNNQLKLATGSTQAAAKAYTALFDIAQRSRVSFTELGGTFASISRAGEALGVSQTRLLGITEAISNAVAISGGSAESARASLVQLSQGLASGTLRGDELNSVMEQTPRLAKALADGLGVSTGELRKMGEQGKITASAVISALESQSRVLSSEVKDSVVTVGQAFTQLQNATTLAVGEFDKASGTSAALASALQGVAGTVQTVGKAFKDNETAIQTTIGAIAGLASAAIIGRLAAVAAGIGSVSASLVTLRVAVAALNPWTLALLAGGAAVGATIASDNQYRKTADGLRATIAELEKLNTSERAKFAGAGGNPDTNKRFNQAVAERLEKITTLRAALDKLAEKDREALAPIGSVGSGDTALRRELARQQAAKTVAEVKKPSGLSDAEKGLALYNDEMAKASGLNSDFAEKWGLLGAAFKAHKISVDDLTAAQAALLKEQTFSKDTAKEWEEQTKASNKAVADSVKEYERLVDGYQKSADAQAAQVQSLQDEEQALAIASAQNISLAQAIEQVTIARLSEAQTKEYKDGNQEAGDAIKQEIENRRKLITLIGGKEARDATAKSAKDAAAEWQKTAKDAAAEWQKTADKINDDITDALMRGFESGKGFAENFRDTLTNMFKTMILRPTISAIVNPVAQGITGMMGLSGAANASSAASSLGGSGMGAVGTVAGFGKTFGSAFADGWGASDAALRAGEFSAAGTNIAQSASSGASGSMGSATQATGAGQTAGGVMNAAGYAMAIYTALDAIDKGQWGKAVGTAVGAYYGGPMLAAVGGYVGSAVDKAFGGGHEYTVGQGIKGKFSNGGFAGQNYQQWQNDGSSGIFGWGGASASSGTNYSAMSGSQTDYFTSSFQKVTAGVVGLADSLGLPTKTILGYSQDISLALGQDAAANQAAIDAMFKSIADGAAATVLDTRFAKAGEGASDALARLFTSLTAVNASFYIMGKTLLSLNQTSGDAASKLADAFGGMDKYQAAADTYYQKFFTQEERNAKTREVLIKALTSVGLTLPDTTAQYRDLVNAQDITTESGLKAYTALISLSGAFAEIAGSATVLGAQLSATFKDVLKSLADLIGNIQDQRKTTASAVSGLTGPTTVTASSIQAGIDSALGGIVSPTTTALVAAFQRKINAGAILQSSSAALSTTQFALDRVNGATTVRDNALTASNSAAATAAATPYYNRVHTTYRDDFGIERGRDSNAYNPAYGTAQANATTALANYNTALADFNAAVSTYGATAALGATATTAYSAAIAEGAAADAAIKNAQKVYNDELRAYVLSASIGLDKLSKLRESTLEYYDQQKALADLMANSASGLRKAMKATAFGASGSATQQSSLQADFANVLAMATVSSGSTLAGYADQLGAMLPELSTSLLASSTSASDYALSVGRLNAQASTVATKLDGQTQVDYLKTTVDLLALIDRKMGLLESSASSAQALIVAAIDAGALRTADGLQQVINALTGQSVAAFATGGSHIGGLRIVGENGPELEATGPSRIWNAADTRSMLSGRGSDAATADELRQMRMDMRAAQIQTATLMQRLVKINEKWDGDGMPTTRSETA